MLIRVHDIIHSDSALNSEQGQAIRAYYSELWKKEDLTLDFTDVVRVSPSFLSQALLPILFELTPQFIEQKVSFVNEPPAFSYAWDNLLKAAAERVRRSAN